MEARVRGGGMGFLDSSCAGLTRASIVLRKTLSKRMDCRVKPGNDAEGTLCPGRDAAFFTLLRRTGPYQAPAFVTAPALQRTASQGLRAALRPGHAFRPYP